MQAAMTGTQYRSAEAAIAEQIRERRLEIDRLRAVSPLRRAILPRGTVHEIDALALRIDLTIARPPGPEVVAILDELAAQLSALMARAEVEAERVRRRSREFPLPPEPKPFPFGSHRRTFSIERPFRDQVRDAKDVREHGVGMIARLERNGTELAFAARGRATNNVFFPGRKVDCMLRTAAPRCPALHLQPRSLFRRAFPPRDTVPIEPAFDEAFLVKGDPSLARALLDAPRRKLLLSMRNELLGLYVGDGVIDLAWRRPFAKDAIVPPEEALAIVTSLARLLYSA